MNCGFVALRLPPSACSGHIGMEGIGFPAKIANISRDKSRRTRYKTAQLSPMSFGLSIAWGGGVSAMRAFSGRHSPTFSWVRSDSMTGLWCRAFDARPLPQSAHKHPRTPTVTPATLRLRPHSRLRAHPCIIPYRP